MLAGVSGTEEAEEEMMSDVSDVKIEIDVAEESPEPWLAGQPDPQGEQSRQTAAGFAWPFKTWQRLERRSCLPPHFSSGRFKSRSWKAMEFHNNGQQIICRRGNFLE